MIHTDLREWLDIVPNTVRQNTSVELAPIWKWHCRADGTKA